MMGTEMVLKMFYSPFNHLKWLVALESFIEFGCHESFRFYRVMNLWVALKGANSMRRWVTVKLLKKYCTPWSEFGCHIPVSGDLINLILE